MVAGLKFPDEEILYVLKFCCAGGVWKNLGAKTIHGYRLAKSSRSIRKPGRSYGINFCLICHCFERRNYDAFLFWISADSKCEMNILRRTKRLQFHRKAVTAKPEYGRQLRGY